MALFRFHRSTLEDSLKTTIIVKSMDELLDIIDTELYAIIHPFETRSFSLKSEPYPNAKDNFDERIGWYTRVVLSTYGTYPDFMPVGFLSEPLEWEE